MKQNVKSVALPHEHGSWGLTFEPLILALLIGYSLEGLLLFLGATFAFLAHQPARVLLTGKNRKRLAWPFLLVYSLLSALFLGLYFRSADFNTALPLLVALFLMLLYLILEYFSLHRALLTEIMASVAMGLIALSIVLTDDWPWGKAWPFLILIYLRTLSTTLYVHFRLKIDRKKQRSIFWPEVWQVLTLLLAIFLRVKQAIPFLAFLSIFFLSGRGLYGLSPWRKPMTVKQIGLAEFFYGVLFVTLSAIGYLS